MQGHSALKYLLKVLPSLLPVEVLYHDLELSGQISVLDLISVLVSLHLNLKSLLGGLISDEDDPLLELRLLIKHNEGWQSRCSKLCICTFEGILGVFLRLGKLVDGRG